MKKIHITSPICVVQSSIYLISVIVQSSNSLINEMVWTANQITISKRTKTKRPPKWKYVLQADNYISRGKIENKIGNRAIR